MLLPICTLLAMACHGVAPSDTASLDAPVYEPVRCTVDVRARRVWCATGGRSPAGPPGSALRPNAKKGNCCTYAYYWPTYLAEDSVAGRWSLSMRVANLLEEPIGTLDGTTVTGVRLLLRGSPATTEGNGTVRVVNADGLDTSAAPARSYWSYGQIIPPNAWSEARTLRFDVPGTVTRFELDFIIAAHVPAERTVPAVRPDTVPAWVSADKNVGGPTAVIGVPFIKRVLHVQFRQGATVQDKALAVALVGGVVIGGTRRGGGEGEYLLRIHDSGSGQGLLDAEQKLALVPQVLRASFVRFLQEVPIMHGPKPRRGAQGRRSVPPGR